MRATVFAAGIALALLALPALAQAPARALTPIRGTVVKLDGNNLTVKPKSGGADVTVALAPNFGVTTMVKKKLSDIKPGDFVASTGRKAPDGTIHAVEVRIFPEALRGRGEGQNPWDLYPGSVMTNATVTGIVAAPKGKTLAVTYKGTQSSFIVDPSTPIMAQVPGTPGDGSLLKPKVYVVILAQKQPDGSLTAANVAATAKGVKPMM